MTLIRTFLKHTVGQHSLNNNPTKTTITDSSSDSSSSTITERLSNQELNQTNDDCSSKSILDLLINNHDDSMRRPLLHIQTTNRCRKLLLLRLINHSTTINTQQEQFIDENISLIDKKLSKELIIRYR